MAAPHVAGALALLKAHYPNHLLLIDGLLESVDHPWSLVKGTFTGGRLNLNKMFLPIVKIRMFVSYLKYASWDLARAYDALGRGDPAEASRQLSWAVYDTDQALELTKDPRVSQAFGPTVLKLMTKLQSEVQTAKDLCSDSMQSESTVAKSVKKAQKSALKAAILADKVVESL